MQTEFTQFSNWLTCQYPHSSARKHTMSDLALFFSWTEKPPSDISPHDVDVYIQYCLSKVLSPLTINEQPIECPVISKRHFLRKPRPLASPPHTTVRRGIRHRASGVRQLTGGGSRR